MLSVPRPQHIQCILHEPKVNEKCHEKFIFFITKKKTVDKTIMAEQQTHFSRKLERLLTLKDFWKSLYLKYLLITEGRGLVFN